MISLLVVAGALLFLFAVVLIFGAPYVPTLQMQIEAALDLMNLRKDQTMLELGCGDGRVLVAAAKRGLKVVGYELNPLLALICWLRTIPYRRQVKVVWGNFWTTQWPSADGIFVFLLDKYMLKLDKKIVLLPNKPVKLVSYAFQVPGKKPITTKNGLYLYKYK